nr:hypothetical protein [Tanacetum cinerariifolium]
MKVRKGKKSDNHVDEDDEVQHAPEPQVEDDEYNLQRGIQISLESLQEHGQAHVSRVAIHEPTSVSTQKLPDAEGKGKGIATDEQAAQSLLDLQQPKKKSTTGHYIFQKRTPITQEASTGPSTQPQDDTSVNLVHDTPFLADAETSADTEKSNSEADTKILNVGEEQGKDVSNMVALKERTIKLDEGRAGSNPVHENLKLITEEQVNIENPLSSSGTLSSMKNLEDAFTFEKRSTDFKQKHQLQDKTMKALASRVYKLEHHDLYLKIDKQVNEVVKEAMFESGSYKSHLNHTTLYDALEVSMQRDNNDELHEALATSQKRRSWKTSDTIEAPSRSSKKKHASPPHVNDDPIPYDMHLSESEDTSASYLSKIKTRLDWLKPLPKEEEPKTLEPEWVIPTNDLPKTKHNWADALAKMYKDLEEKKLLWKIRDMGSFIKWYYKQIRKSKVVKADLEGQAYKTVSPFHKNNISFQFHMEECHLLKAAYYLDFGLEELVPSLWTESESAYDISSAYGISQWWFKRKELYITRHSAPSDRRAVRSNMRILSVVSLKTFSRYSYTYLKEIVLRRADYKEYKISKAGFKIYIRMILKTCTYFIFNARSTTYLEQTKFPYPPPLTYGLGTSSSDNGSKSENKRIVPTEMEPGLEQTQQGSSHEVSGDGGNSQGVDACTSKGERSADLKDIFISLEGNDFYNNPQEVSNHNGRYGVSVPALTKDHKNKIQYAYPEEGNTPYSSYMGINILEDIKRGPYSKKPPIRHVLDLRSVGTEFPAIVFNDSLTSNETPSFKPTFSYKIIYTNDLKTDSKIDNEKVNKPLFPSLEPSVSCIDDLDFFKGVENEFSAIGYNDALTSKLDFSTEPTLCPQHINKFDLKYETSLSEYDEVEQSILKFNDIFPFNTVYPDDLKSDKGNDDNEIDMIQSLGNLFVSFGILFDPKRYYKHGDCTRMLGRPRYGYGKNHKEKAKTRQERTRDCEEYSKAGSEDIFVLKSQTKSPKAQQ